MSNKPQETALTAIKAIYKKGFFEIGDNKYTFTKMPWKKGKRIHHWLTDNADQLEEGKLGCLDTPYFEDVIEPLLFQYTLVDGCKVSTVENHFDENTGDYNEFILTSTYGHSAPFIREVDTASASESKESLPVILKKQM